MKFNLKTPNVTKIDTLDYAETFCFADAGLELCIIVDDHTDHPNGEIAFLVLSSGKLQTAKGSANVVRIKGEFTET